MKMFIFVSLPKMGAFVIGPKCLFVVCNMIVIYLVSESKLLGSSASSDSPTSDTYEEYVKHCKGVRSLPTKEREEKLEVGLIEEHVEVIKEAIAEEEEEKKKGGEEDKDKEKGKEHLDGEEELGLHADEFTKRVEDFIARVNEQRRLEAKNYGFSGREQERRKIQPKKVSK